MNLGQGILLGLIVALAGCGSAPLMSQDAREETDEGWQILFDGRSLSGWTGNHGGPIGESWSVIDGNIVVRGGRTADLVSEDQFEDFELQFEWRISENGNSGVVYYVSDDPGSIWMSGIEYQLLDDTGYPDWIGTNQAAGAAYGLYAPQDSTVAPVGQYNTSVIRVSNNHVEHWLNGELAVEFQIGSNDWQSRVGASKFAEFPQFAASPKGRIALQDHGDEVWFRNIGVREL